MPRGDDYSQGGRPPFDPPPVLVLRSSRAWPRVWRGCALAVATCLGLRPRASCFRLVPTPRRDDPPSTPRRSCPWGDDPPSTPRRYLSCGLRVLGRGCGGAVRWPLPRVWASGLGLPASGLFRRPGGTTPLRPPAGHAHGGTTPLRPPAGTRLAVFACLAEGVEGLCVGRCHVSGPPASGFLLPACSDAQEGRPPFDPPPVMPRGHDPPSTPRRCSCRSSRVAGRGLRSLTRHEVATVNRRRSTVNGFRASCPRPPASCFAVMPRGDDPPSTPRRCSCRSSRVAGRGRGRARIGRCHVSGASSAFLRLPPPSSAFLRYIVRHRTIRENHAERCRRDRRSGPLRRLCAA
jgi:hypothetical protein